MATPKKEQLTAEMPPELMKKFREVAMKKFDYKRGYIRKATEEALTAWIEENKDVLED